MQIDRQVPNMKPRPARSSRWRGLAALNLIAVAAVLLYPAPAMASEPRTYDCSTSGPLEVQITRTAAVVRFAGREYRLPRKRSSIGTRYGSPSAALMIDGHFAAFITERGPRARQCFEVPSLAKRS